MYFLGVHSCDRSSQVTGGVLFPPESAFLTRPTSLMATPVLVVHGLRIPPNHKTMHMGIFQWTCSMAFIRDPAQ